ncbi:hypothetical protein B296_00031308 [Ensete ventricosum]|uniref:Uncharacterized protein n=1 Tax=Ensete ventricosum TaxID=4639 RepID=A0A426YKQ1_ENSVE|nr:hypothetical protein B296_00031308 [Ensete ventricosum]
MAHIVIYQARSAKHHNELSRFFGGGEVPTGVGVDHYCLIVQGVALADPRGADALAAMRSYFNVDSIVTTRRLVEMRKNYFVPPEYELHAPLPGEHPYDTFSSGFSLSTDALEAGWLVQTQHERVLVLQAANKELKLGANQDLVVVIEFHAKGLEEDVKKLRAELESLKNQRRGLEGEVEVLCSSLDRARDDRARLDGDVLSLIEAASLLEVELKAEEPKAVATYKASRGFESGLEKMG